MNDLISRQAAIDAIRELESGEDFNFNNGLICAMNNIDALPSAQSERKKGKWIVYYECPKCGEITKDFTEYCPFCGADMRGGQDG